MAKYLANAFSLGMLKAPGRVEFEPMSLEQARAWASDAESIVGHADTAAVFGDLLGRPVAHDRRQVTLSAGDQVLVGQIGARLPEGATTLPPGAELQWLLVKVPPGWVPISSPFLNDPGFVEGLKAQTQGATTRVLVAIPSNDAILAVALAQRPRRILFPITQRSQLDAVAAYRVWLGEHLGPVAVETLPPTDGDEAQDLLTDDALVAALHDGLERVPPSDLGILVTSGTSVHTALLTSYARAVSARVFHVEVEYERGRPLLDKPYRRVMELDEPADIADQLRVRRALDFALGGNFTLARSARERCTTLGDLHDPIGHAIDLLDARESLRLDEARASAKALDAALKRRPSGATRAQPLWSDLDILAKGTANALATPATALEGEMHFAAEALQRGRAERQRGRLDLSALLFYRFAEAVVSARLRHEHRIDPDHGLTEEAAQELGERTREIAGELHGRDPRPIRADAALGLVDGLVVLLARQDPALPGGVAAVRDVKVLTDQRNRGIFAHGFDAMQPEHAERWEVAIKGTLDPLLQATGDPGTWGRIRSAHQRDGAR